MGILTIVRSLGQQPDKNIDKYKINLLEILCLMCLRASANRFAGFIQNITRKQR